MESKTLRRRINVSRGMTGNISWEATIEIEGGTETEILAESDRLVNELTQRYPAPEPKGKTSV